MQSTAGLGVGPSSAAWWAAWDFGDIDLSRLCCTWCVLSVKVCFWLGEDLEECMFGDYLVESFWPGLVLGASSLWRVMWLTGWLVSLLPHSTILLSFIHLLRDVKKLNWYWKVLQGLWLKGVICVWRSTVASLDEHPYIFLLLNSCPFFHF